MTGAPDDPGRLAREREHHQKISSHAEDIWDWASPAGRRRADRRAGFYCEDTGLRPGMKALEVGCGTALFLEKVARQSGARVYGLDLSPDLLRLARARLAGVPHVHLFCADAERLPFPDGAFDAVYGSSILHHLRLRPALAEVHRVLRPGGWLSFTEPNLWNPQIAFMYNVGPRARWGLSEDEYPFSRTAARGTLRDVGFVDVSVEPFDFLHPAAPAALVDAVARLGNALERTPLVRLIAGSLRLRARRA